MPIAINVSDALLQGVAQMNDEQRDVAEKEKSNVYLDETIAEIILSAHHGVANPGEDIVDATMAEIRENIDAVIALIAYCKSIDEVDAIKTLSDKLGRRNRIKINIGSLEGKFREVFAQIDKKYSISTQGQNDRILIRKKVRAIIEMINDAINSGKSRFK